MNHNVFEVSFADGRTVNVIAYDGEIAIDDAVDYVIKTGGSISVVGMKLLVSNVINRTRSE